MRRLVSGSMVPGAAARIIDAAASLTRACSVANVSPSSTVTPIG